MPDDFDKLKEQIFLASLNIAIFDGWTDKTLTEAALISGVNLIDAKQFFPRGGIDLAIFFHQYEDRTFLKNLRKIDFKNLSHFKKVELALIKRFEIILKNKEAFKRSLSLFSLPLYQIEGLNLVFSTCDIIWIEIGDNSLGFDWYTKRIILVSIYLATLLYLFGDDSTNGEETFKFINRKIEELKNFGKFKNDCLKSFKNLDLSKFKNF